MKTFEDLKDYLKNYQGDDTTFLLPYRLFNAVVLDDEVLESLPRETPICGDMVYATSGTETKYLCLELEIDGTTYVFVSNKDLESGSVIPFTEEGLT